MKRLLLSLTIISLLMLGLSSCNQDLADLNSVSIISNIKGNWHCTLDEGNITQDYQVEIVEDTSTTNGILIHNFFNNGATAYATVNENLEITLPSQKLGQNTVQATGVISDDFQRIDWNLTVDGDVMTATFTPGTVAKKLLSK